MTFDRIFINPKKLGGKPCIKGTRIPVAMVLELLEDGLTFNEIIQDYYPQIICQDIQACLEHAKVIVNGEEIHFVEDPVAR